MKQIVRRWILISGALLVYTTFMYLMVLNTFNHALTYAQYSVAVDQLKSEQFLGEIQHTDTGITFRWVDAREPIFVRIHLQGSIISFSTWLYPAEAKNIPTDIFSIDKLVYTTTSNVYKPRTYHVLSLPGTSVNSVLGMSNALRSATVFGTNTSSNAWTSTIFVIHKVANDKDKPYMAFSGITATALTMPVNIMRLFLLLMVFIPLVYAVLCNYVTRHARASMVVGGVVAAVLVWRMPDIYAGYVLMCYLDTFLTRISIAIIIIVLIFITMEVYRRFSTQLQRVFHVVGLYTPTLHRQSFFVTAFVGSILWGIVTWSYVDSQQGDWGIHINCAYDIISQGRLIPKIPHFLFHITLIVMHYFSVGLLSFNVAAVVLVMLITWVLCLIVWNACARAIPPRHFLVGAVILVIFSAPIALLYPFDGHLYLGYYATNVFHNPTILMLKPFALLHLLLLVHIFNTDETDNYASELAILFVLSFLGVLAKPSYALAIIPAQVLIFVLRYSQHHHWWRRDLITVVVSSTAFTLPLLMQFFTLYYVGTRSLRFKPIIEIITSECLSSNLPMWTCTLTISAPIIIKLLASIAILVCIWRVVPRLITYVDIQLVVIATFSSICVSYFLSESDYRITYKATYKDLQDFGNLSWSVQICLFLFIVVALNHFARALSQRHESQHWSIYLPYVVAMFHVVSGIIWYATQFTLCCW